LGFFVEERLVKQSRRALARRNSCGKLSGHVAPHQTFSNLLKAGSPLLALAPMQDVTDLSFWRVIMRYGGADVYWTEYFRVHAESRLERWILQSIVENPTNRPVVAQMIGNDIPALVRTARELQQYSIAAIDLNLGCPAPIVYRKCAGGGLLRDPARIDSILGALRDAVTIPFTVKTRIGFDSPAAFDEILPLFAKHAVDLVTVHGRTVAQMYRPGVRYDLIAHAARELHCPVLANGDIHGAEQAMAVLAATGAHGLMIGRGVIRNPWLFQQIRQRRASETVQLPTGSEVLSYIRELWDSQVTPDATESAHAQRMKKFMNFLGVGVPEADRFLHDIRRVQTRSDFFRVCEAHLDNNDRLSLEPASAEDGQLTDVCS
jgi:tRNA-dihydrouridine synthase B